MAIQVNQDFELTLSTSTTMTSMVDMKIIYKKPGSTTTGVVTATASTTNLVGTITSAINNKAGTWQFQAYARNDTGKTYYGSIANLTISSNL